MNLYFCDYNNYYNRIVKRPSNLLSSYSDYFLGSGLSGVSFNPNDGVDTTYRCKRNFNEIGNYLICSLDNIFVHSRWFIIDANRDMSGMYKLTLHRDLIAESYDNILNAPMFVEKATLSDSDPAIFNRENITVNQIKTSEELLKDETGCAWVVGYVPKDAFKSTTKVEGDVILDDAADFTYNNLSEFPLNSILNTSFNGKPINIKYRTKIDIDSTIVNRHVVTLIYNGTPIDSVTADHIGGLKLTRGLLRMNNSDVNNINAQLYNTQGWASAYNSMNNIAYAYTNYSGNNSTVDEQDIIDFSNKIINVDGIYYRVNINKSQLNSATASINTDTGMILNYWRPNIATSFTGLYYYNESTRSYVSIPSMPITGTPNNSTFSIEYNYYQYNVALEQIFINAEVEIDSDRYHLEDSPYDMFCIPYSDDLDIYQSGTKILTANKSVAVNMAIEIAHDGGKDTVYDVQLLPYCPVRYAIKEDGTFDIGNAKVNFITKEVEGVSSNIGVVLWGIQSAFTFNIEKVLTASNKKLSNECDMYRLCSPNFNGQFEFSVAKNDGVESFNVDCNYKPFNPYIHINPNFKNLYGQDFNDARGLICGGDFSLPQISSAWADFQLNNKNYQNIFDRDIKNMEIQNKYQNLQAGINAGAGALTGAASGMMLGAMVGGPVGAGIGAALGGVASLGGGIADLQIQKSLQNEAIDYKKDQFGYQLGNIQALPTSLSRTSAFTYNNKIFPLLEYYTCTETEKRAIANKIAYNGMTVMRVGTISEFLNNRWKYEDIESQGYFKGKLIRFETNEDFHYVNMLANELDKGVFIWE